ncbi:hypothetical protein ACQPYK_26120 [Streptosporangium sp. CA-135522]
MAPHDAAGLRTHLLDWFKGKLRRRTTGRRWKGCAIRSFAAAQRTS